MQRSALEPTRKTDPARTGRRRAEDVALCFKVSFEFRRRFKLESVRRNLSMTEFLIRATESYLLAEAQRTEAVAQNQGSE
jgi:hypothetical protein